MLSGTHAFGDEGVHASNPRSHSVCENGEATRSRARLSPPHVRTREQDRSGSELTVFQWHESQPPTQPTTILSITQHLQSISNHQQQ